MHRIEGVGIRRDPLVAIFLEDPPLFRFWTSPEYYLLFPSNLTENRPEQDSFGGGTSLSLHDDKLVQRSGYFHRLRREHAELDR